MIHDVSIPAALLAGLVSFLSPCVLPLVPPYLVYLTGATIEHVANDETADGLAAGRDAGRVAVRARLLHGVRRARRQRQLIGGLIRAWSAQLSIVAGIVIIVMGLHFLGLTRIGFLMREGRLHGAEAGRPVGRLCDGARVRVRLDAVHRADPRGDPVGRGVGGDGGEGRGLARGLFGRARHSVPARGVHGRAVLVAARAMKRHLATVERAMGGLLVLTGIAFLTGTVSSVSIWLLETFPALQNFG